MSLLTAGCDSSRRSPGPELLDEVDLDPVATVEVDADGFEPSEISVESGDAFVIVNTGDEPHSMRIEDPFVDTGELFPGEETTIVLTTEGTAEAVDDENPEAALTIEVTETTDPD